MKDFDKIANIKSLVKAFFSCMKGTAWKENVQKLRLNLLRECRVLSIKLYKGIDIREGFIKFRSDVCGKMRRIRGVKIRERIVQKSLCDNFLVPLFGPSLIYDEAAGLKGKGPDFSRRRLQQHLRSYFCTYGNEGYALTIDFKKFYDYILHDIVLAQARKKIKDDRIFNLYKRFITAFSDDQEHGITLGLGSQVSQIASLYYTNKILHWLKEKKHFKYLGKFGDDIYILSYEKWRLEEVLVEIVPMLDELGIQLNTKKTRIVKIKDGVTYLKATWYLTDTGKVYAITNRKDLRKRIARLKRLGENGIERKKIIQVYDGWMAPLRLYKDKDAMRKLTKALSITLKTLKEKENEIRESLCS